MLMYLVEEQVVQVLEWDPKRRCDTDECGRRGAWADVEEHRNRIWSCNRCLKEAEDRGIIVIVGVGNDAW